MRKTYKILILLATLFGILNVSNNGVVLSASSNEYSQPPRKYQEVNEDVDAFYTSTKSGDVSGLKGDELLEQLAKILEDNHKYYNTYGELRGGMCYSDEDPSNPENIVYFYSGVSASNSWGDGHIYNREHVWPKANSNGLFTSDSGPNPVTNDSRGAGADIHHLRPEDEDVNQERSNYRFADLNKTGTEILYDETISTGSYISNSKFEPSDDVKGDVARILMYMYTHYSTEVNENIDRASYSNTPSQSKSGALDITKVVYTSSGTKQAAWDLLMDWNSFDPVDAFEMNRNNYCTAVTGVRNPFIDHPEFATMIWDSTYSGEGALIDESFKPSTDHIYQSVNKVEATCTTTGMKAHYTCSHCDKLFTKSGTFYFEVSEASLIIAAGHDYQSVSQVNATCTVNGTKAHYTCSNCDKIFTKSGTTYTETTDDSLVINAAHSYGNLISATSSTCKINGMKAHYKCSKCNTYFTADKEPTTLEELTLDLIDHAYKLQEEQQSTCTVEGMMAHYTCGTCDKLFTKENDVYIEKTTQELTISKKNHTYNYVEEIEASCESNGVKEHYECDICQRLFVKVDEEFVETTLEDITIPSSHNLGELISETSTSCEQGGMKAHYVCLDCEKYFTEEKVETTYQDLQVPATNHSYGEKIARVEPTCENDGTRAHYQCSECQKLFVLTSGSYVEVTEADLRIPQSGHSFNTIDKVEESCTTSGVALHYQCKTCNNLFIKENGAYVKVSEEQLVVNPKEHEYTQVEGVNPTCKEEGLLSHYKCSVCDKLFVKENDNYKEVIESELVLAVIDHSYGQEIAAVNATCDTNGNSAYYKCSECEKLFIKSGSSYISVTQQEVTITAYGHNYYKVNGKTPTCKEEGLKEHYKCSRCNKVFILENNQYVVTNESALTLAKVEHSYDNECDTTCNTCNQEREVPLHVDENEDNKCDYCGTQMEIKNNKTRNIVFISIGGVALLGLLVLLILKLKK